MHKIKNRTAPSSYLEQFEQPAHSYPTRVSSGNYRIPQIMLRKCRFRISIRGPATWNNLVGSTEKETQSSSLFKTEINSKLHNIENALTFLLPLLLNNSLTEATTDGNNVLWIYYIVAYVLLVLVGAWWQIGFLRFSPLKLVEQIVWFFYFWLACYLIHFI